MFEPAACGRLYLTTVALVSGDALLELKALLRATQRPDTDGVLQAQHRPCFLQEMLMPLREPSATLATDPVHPLHPRPPFHTFPQDIQEKTIRLLARLLRLQADQTLASDQTQD